MRRLFDCASFLRASQRRGEYRFHYLDSYRLLQFDRCPASIRSSRVAIIFFFPFHQSADSSTGLFAVISFIYSLLRLGRKKNRRTSLDRKPDLLEGDAFLSPRLFLEFRLEIQGKSIQVQSRRFIHVFESVTASKNSPSSQFEGHTFFLSNGPNGAVIDT